MTKLYSVQTKPNDETLYIHAKSNHPPIIMKQIPISIENPLRNLSSSQQMFDEVASHYQEALEKSGYSYKLPFEQPSAQNNVINARRSRKRNGIWFNPHFRKTFPQMLLNTLWILSISIYMLPISSTNYSIETT